MCGGRTCMDLSYMPPTLTNSMQKTTSLLVSHYRRPHHCRSSVSYLHYHIDTLWCFQDSEVVRHTHVETSPVVTFTLVSYFHSDFGIRFRFSTFSQFCSQYCTYWYKVGSVPARDRTGRKN